MTINYKGQMKDKKFNTRTAVIEWSEKEQEVADRLFDLMNKFQPNYNYSLFDEMAIVSVDDKEDYEEFKEWYKKAKKVLKILS